MAPNDSHHGLPVNSMLFDSQSPLRSPYFTATQNPTLVNLQDAQDTTITALPQPVVEQPPSIVKESIWHKVLGKIKALFRRKESPGISSPTEFQHLATGGPEPLRTSPPRVAMVAGAKRATEGTAVEEGDDSDWEDVEETRVFRQR